MAKGGKAPKAPDYTALAQQQGQQNTEAARLAAQLNRVNTQGPGGSVSYRQDGDTWTQTTTLSPEQRALYNQQTGNAQGAGRAMQGRLEQVASMGAPDFSGQPARVSNVAAAPLRQSIDAPSVAQTSVEGTGPYRSDINAASAGREKLDFSGAPQLTSDFSAERQRVEDSLYGRAASRLDPQFAQADEAQRTRLLNSGIREGSKAWESEMQRSAWEREDAYGGARDRAIQAGGAEQSRLFADALARRQQSVGEETTAGTFENQSVQQRFGNELARTDLYNVNQDRQFGQDLSRGQFANQATQQQFGNEAARTDLYNRGQETDFAQGLTNAQLSNQARDSGVNEEVLRRSLPLQELQQLYGLSQGPQATMGGAVPQVAGPAPADIMGAGMQQYNAQLDAYNARQARNSNLWGSVLGAGGLIGAAAMPAGGLAFLSDRRTKEDIEPIGHAANGLTIYRFRYIGDPVDRVGVMADEVRERFPHAVYHGDDGFDRVDYAAIGLAGLVARIH